MTGSALPKVIDRLLGREQSEVIARLALDMAPNTTRVHVRPMERFGFSSAKLCIAHFDEAGVGRPFVVKVDQIAEFDKERAATADLLAFFEDADVHTRSHGEHGAIAYPLRESARGDIETFEDVLRAAHRDEARLTAALERVFTRCCGKAHAAQQVERRKLADEYSRYHWGGATAAALEGALGEDYSDRTFDFYGATIIDPRAVKERLDSFEPEIIVAPIHGDLHGSNIVFDEDDHPHLIDFAWGDRCGQLMKDFVLMECSLRFFAFPRNFDADLQARVDAALLEEHGADRVREITKGSSLEGSYRCLASLIDVTRTAARTAAGADFFGEYRQAQFMIMYRMLQYPNYPFHPTLRALGMLGESVLAHI